MSRPLKVLVYLFFPAGGIGRYTHEVLLELAKFEDLDIEVVCLPEFQWRDNPIYRTAPILFSISHRIPWIRKIRFLIGQFINPRRLCRHAQKTGVELVHICQINYLTYPLWRKAFRRTAARLVVSAHDIRRAKPILFHPYEVNQLIKIYQACDGILVNSPAQIAELSAFAHVAGDHIRTVPHGPYAFEAPLEEDLRSRYGLPSDVTVALFFGRIREDKNLEGLLEALAYHDDTVLLVAGAFPTSGKDVSYYRERIATLNLKDRVRLLDRHIPDNEVAGLFEVCDWVALPYAPTFNSQSGILSTAVVHHKPILATPCPTFRDTLAQYQMGCVATSADRDDLVAAMRQIEKMLREPSHTFEFSRYLDDHSWAENARLTHKLYSELLGEDA